MIYLDSSVAVAPCWSKRVAHHDLYGQTFCSPAVCSNTRCSAEPRRAGAAAFDRIAFVELSPLVLERALEPFPGPVRTLDALYPASMEFLRGRRFDLRLATYDRRMNALAQALAIPLVRLS